MRLIIRNFIRIFQRFRLAMTLNILGLSIAFVAFMLLIMQWSYDQEFDTHDPNADYIYRINSDGGDRGELAIISRPLAEIINQSSPHILEGCLLGSSNSQTYFSLGEGENQSLFPYTMNTCSPSVTKVFHFEMVEGDANSIELEENFLVPESFAKKWFPDKPATGQSIFIANNSFNFKIGGVYKDFPENNTLKNIFYTSFGDSNKHDWSNWSYNYYIRTDIKDQADEVDAIIQSILEKDEVKQNRSNINLIVHPLKELHHSAPALYDPTPRTSHQMMLVIISIAIVILLIATINFTNFSTAISPMRIRNVNTQKVFGATTGKLRMDLLIESMIVGLLSFGIGVMFLWMLKDTPMVDLFKADIHVSAHPQLLACTAGIAVLIGLFAAAYPAYYTTSFQPALALKGSFGISPKGKALRRVLVGFQFVASFALIVAALFMYLQNRYAFTTPLGFDKEQLIISNMDGCGAKHKVFEEQIKRHPEIEDVTFANVILCNENNIYMNWGREFKDEDVNYDVLEVSPSFPRVMGIKPIEGRDFRDDDENTRYGAYLFNETAAKKYGFKVGDAIDSTQIVGFVPDFIYNSMHLATPPAALMIWGKVKWGAENWDKNGRWYSVTYVKTKPGADLRKAIEAVREEINALAPKYPHDVRFFDSVLDQLYKDDQWLTTIITMFSLLAVFISIVGVFGLVVFDSEYKRKEIGIRKVMGATTPQILLMLNKGYAITLLICFCISVPIAYYGVSSWLENFAYKIPIYWWVFPIALIVVGAITLLTVTYQSWHAANENPVNSIKSE